MALTRPYPVDVARPNAADIRKGQSAVFPREGIFPDPVTLATAGIAYAGSGWSVGARAFTANVKRGGAPFSQAYGAAQIANDGVVASAWTLPGAPSSGSITSLLWVRATDSTQGDGTPAVPSGETVARSIPTFGVTTGTTTTAPVLPAGAELIATVTIASTSTSAATSTIVQSYDFAGVNGGVQYARTEAKRDASAPIEGEVWYVLATQKAHQRIGSDWVHVSGRPDVASFTGTSFWSSDTNRPARAVSQAGRGGLEGAIVSTNVSYAAGTAYTLGSIPATHAPKAVKIFPAFMNKALGFVYVYPDGTIILVSSVSFGPAALDLSLDGITWADKRIAP